MLQVENLHSSDQGGVRYRNTMDGLKYIIRNQGWKKLFSGLSVNYIKVISYSLCVKSVYFVRISDLIERAFVRINLCFWFSVDTSIMYFSLCFS